MNGCRSSHEERGLKWVDAGRRIRAPAGRSSHEERGLKFEDVVHDVHALVSPLA